MSKNLRAENLTICVPNRGCNKDCPYCISKITGYVKPQSGLMYLNSEKVRKVAETAGVSSILFTGKGEPLLNMEGLLALADSFQDYPLELQTNGLLLSTGSISTLRKARFDIIAISIDHPDQLTSLAPAIEEINRTGMIVRLTINMTHSFDLEGLRDRLISSAKEMGVHQLLLRRLTAPKTYDFSSKKAKKTARWIHFNTWQEGMFHEAQEELVKGGTIIRRLGHGVNVVDVEGISMVVSDYCIQEEDNGDDLRSLIFMEDGHLYTKWNSRASILF